MNFTVDFCFLNSVYTLISPPYFLGVDMSFYGLHMHIRPLFLLEGLVVWTTLGLIYCLA